MDPELKQLLTLLAFSAPAGLVIGLVIRKKFPESTKSYAKWCRDGQWKLFALGVVLFAALAAITFWDGNPYLGWFSVTFGLFELWALIALGFKPLDDVTRDAIDSSDPTKLRPFRFWMPRDSD